MGRKEEAEEQYKHALEADPNNVNAHINYGFLLYEIGRKEEAEEQYKLALEADPNNVNAHNIYGNLLKEMGERRRQKNSISLLWKRTLKMQMHTIITDFS